MAAGDGNGDGKMDVVTANAGLQLPDGTSNVSLLLGTGHGNFGTATNLAVDTNPQDVILAGCANGCYVDAGVKWMLRGTPEGLAHKTDTWFDRPPNACYICFVGKQYSI